MIPSFDQRRCLALLQPEAKELIYLNFRTIDPFNNYSVEKIAFGNDHCLLLLTSDIEGDIFGGFGSNKKGQLGLELNFRNSSKDDYYSEPKEIYTFPLKKRKIIDFATCDDYSIILIEDYEKGKRRLFRFGIDSFNSNQTSPSSLSSSCPITPINEEECHIDMISIDKVHLTINGSLILLQSNKNTVYIKDNTRFGQFRELHHFMNKIISMSTGMNNVIISLNNNTIVSFDSNHSIRNEEDNRKDDQQKYFDNHLIRKVICGLRHTLVLCQDGALFSFGDNSYYQCGGNEKSYTKPYPIIFKSSKERIFICDISCGDSFSMAKSTRGDIYIWGTVPFFFTHGENVYFTPQKIDQLFSNNVKKLFAFNNSALFYIENY